MEEKMVRHTALGSASSSSFFASENGIDLFLCEILCTALERNGPVEEDLVNGF